MNDATARPTREVILQRTLQCIRSCYCRPIAQPDEDTGLNSDFWMGGNSFLRLGELLEEEFGITIGCDELIDIALKAMPSVKHLLDLIEEKLDA